MLQDELYEHLDEADVAKVEKSANEAMEWMNNNLNLQNKRSLTLDPVIKAKDIQAKAKVSFSTKLTAFCEFWRLFLYQKSQKYQGTPTLFPTEVSRVAVQLWETEPFLRMCYLCVCSLGTGRHL